MMLNLIGLDFENVGVGEIESPKETIDIKKIILDAKEYIEEQQDYASFLNDFMQGVYG